MTDKPGEGPEDPVHSEDPDHPDHHEHHLSEELHKIEDEAYVDSYNWGPTILGILLAVILIGVAVVGWIWFA